METILNLLPLIFLIGIMYVLLIRPQKKKEKQINAMRSSIKTGDDIITIGGIYGKVTRVKDEALTIQVGADRTKIEVTRWAVSKIVNGEGNAPVSRPNKTKTTFQDEKAEEPVERKPRRRLDSGKNVEPETSASED